MSHSRFALGFSRSRKISRLSDAAYRLWSSAIDYTREQLTDGFLDEKDLQTIPRGGAGGSWKVTVVRELIDAGLWTRSGSGWQIREFLDWQDSAAQVRALKDKARERMRSVRANKTRTSQDVPLTYSSILDPDPGSAVDPDLETRARGAMGLELRAQFWLSNPALASLEHPNPEKWPETGALVAKLKAVFGGTEQTPRYSGDPRMQVLLARWSEGREQADLLGAIEGAGLNEHIRSKPDLQTLQTILKDSAAVDKYLRHLMVAPVVATHPRGTRAADGLEAQLARIRDLEAAERQGAAPAPLLLVADGKANP